MTTNNPTPRTENDQQLPAHLDLQQLFDTLQTWRDSRIEFVADARHLIFEPAPGGVRIAPCSPQVGEWLPMEGLPLRPWTLGHIAGRVDPAVPVQYLRTLLEKRPGVGTELLNKTRPGKRWFVRGINGHVRAVLSDQYRVIDNLDLAVAALTATKEHGGRPIYASLTERSMRLQLTNLETWEVLADAERNQGKSSHAFTRFGGGEGNDSEPGKVHPLVTISNSETGEGGCSVRYGILTARCVNTAVIETAINEVHLGSRMPLGMLRDDTAKAEALALSLKLRDAINAGLHPNTFARMVAIAQKAQEMPVEAPQDAARAVLTLAGVASDERVGELLAHFVADYDRTAWGLAGAVSRMAQDETDPDNVSALESAAGAVIRGEVALVAAK